MWNKKIQFLKTYKISWKTIKWIFQWQNWTAKDFKSTWILVFLRDCLDKNQVRLRLRCWKHQVNVRLKKQKHFLPTLFPLTIFLLVIIKNTNPSSLEEFAKKKWRIRKRWTLNVDGVFFAARQKLNRDVQL